MANLTLLRPKSYGKLPSVGSQKSLCAACGEIFKSVSGFDAHRVTRDGGRVCLNPDEMEARGMSINGKGFWINAKYIGGYYEPK